jgi:exosortase/archaeosortase family protein
LIPVPDKHLGGRRLVPALAIFLLSFLALQLGWHEARGTRLERWVIDYATVRTGVLLINTLTPQAAAVAEGASILAPDGGINVRNGCEGTEVLFLLLAALLAYPFSWRLRLVGAVVGAAYVFIINQARLLVLFYAIRNDRLLFSELHGVVAPLVLILCTLLFFVALLSWDRPRRMDCSG